MISLCQRAVCTSIRTARPQYIAHHSILFGSSRRWLSSSEQKPDTGDKNSHPKEDVEDAQSASKVDNGYEKALNDLKTAEASAKELHHKLLLKYADAENKRRERVTEIKKRNDKYVKDFGEKIQDIYTSLDNVCGIAEKRASHPEVDEKVKSFAEGLIMTRGIFKNILDKHNISIKPESK